MSHVTRQPIVENDLIEIWLYIAEDNIKAADRVFDAVEATFQKIAQAPGIGTEYQSASRIEWGAVFSGYTLSKLSDFLSATRKRHRGHSGFAPLTGYRKYSLISQGGKVKSIPPSTTSKMSENASLFHPTS